MDFTSLIAQEKIKKIIGESLKDMEKEIEEVNFRDEKTIFNSFSGRIIQTLKEFRMPVTVRLDFSMREKPFFTDVSYIETNFPVGPYPHVAHLKIEEMMAEKVRAILTRTRGRDFFDLWFMFSKGISIDWNLVNKKKTLYQKRTNLNELIEVIRKFPQSEIKEDLTKFLPLTHRSLVEKIKDLTLEKLKKS